MVNDVTSFHSSAKAAATRSSAAITRMIVPVSRGESFGFTRSPVYTTSNTIAAAGQYLAHFPHPLHRSKRATIARAHPFSCFISSTFRRHSRAHRPHPVHDCSRTCSDTPRVVLLNILLYFTCLYSRRRVGRENIASFMKKGWWGERETRPRHVYRHAASA